MEFWQRNITAKSQRKIRTLAKKLTIDFKALNILFNYCWNFDNPNCFGVEGKIPEADFIYGLEKGVLKKPRTLSHKQVLDWLLQSKSSISKEAVSNAFISSLTSQHRDHEYILGSFSCFLSMSPNIFEKALSKNGVNGLKSNPYTYDLNYLQYRRFIGYVGSLQDHIIFSALIFEDFSKYKSVDLKEEAKVTLAKILDTSRNLSGETTLTQVCDSLKGIVKGNKRRRQYILEVLAICDILQPAGITSIREDYHYLSHCPLPSHFYSKEWSFPMCHWKGKHGVNEAAVEFWFPGFEK